jgi:hypothetical protein
VPSGPGFLSWGLNDGDTTPHLTGTLHLDHSSGVCARMNLRYLTEGGIMWHSEPGGDVCAPDNGQWVTAGSNTVSIAE